MLLITPGFAANESDDSCIPPLQLLVRGLHDRGEKVQVIALEYPFRSAPYQWHGVPVFPCNGRNRKWLRWRTQARAHRYAKDLMEAGKGSSLNSFWLGQAWIVGRELAKRFHLSHSTTLMGQDVLMAVNGRYLRRLTAEDAAQLSALSDFQAAQFQANTGLKVGKIIPWGIDYSDFENLQPFDKAVDILGVGSLLPVKNWEMWVRSIALVARQRPNVQAVLVGDGPELEKITSLIHQLGLTHNIRLTGNLSRVEVLRWMASARVLLHTARFESYGYVLAEAAAAGCRVVGTPVGIASSVGETGSAEQALAEQVMGALAETVRISRMPFLMEETVAAYLQLLS
jgi:glycosyltransferase involved in cell wall biosynthesis